MTLILIQVRYGIIIHYMEQCKLAIHFAENNFGSFGHIFFVIVLFEPESKTPLSVLLHVHRATYGEAYTWRVRASKNPIF